MYPFDCILKFMDSALKKTSQQEHKYDAMIYDMCIIHSFMKWYQNNGMNIHKSMRKATAIVKLRSLSIPDYRLSFSNKLLSGRYIDKKSLASESIGWWWQRWWLQSYAYASFIDFHFIAMSVYPSNWLHNTHALNCDDYDYYLRLHVQCTQICVCTFDNFNLII